MNIQYPRTLARLSIGSLAFLLAMASAARHGVAAGPAEFSAQSLEFFESKIRPLLVDNCYTCHSAATKPSGGLRVDDRNGLLAGGDRGAAVVPGNAHDSLLLRAISHADGELKMPPGKQLDAEQIADLRRWIDDGAAWPGPDEDYDLGSTDPEYDRLRQQHWAWQPLANISPPPVAGTAWPATDIDRFILARLEAAGLQPNPDASRAALIRRIAFDLTGLPPTAAEVETFLSDDSPNALEKLVDRLLASPAYGEHWGRHWLDVARYAESTGSSRNLPYPHAWRYRDYVIAAFNADKPFDKFIREQIAGDLLPAAGHQQRDEQRVATGFLALGVKDVNQRFKTRFVMDNIDEQIDTVSRSFLAITASCARCHDHKFDPIPASDYYALAGIFASTDLCAGVRNKMGGGGLDYYDPQMILQIGSEADRFEPSPEAAAKIKELEEKVEVARLEFQALRGKPEGNELGDDGRPKRAIARQKMNRLRMELNALKDPVANGGRAAFGVRDAAQVADTQIRIRGEAEQLGPTVPRGFLSVVQIDSVPAIPAGESGRLQLADWIASEHNPLTSRVIVNRVWSHLFGRGIVSSVDNFGINGDIPTHPQLLDYLAAEFVREGWSIKKLVRTLVLSRTYRLSADDAEASLAVDPQNRFQWRHDPRRLTAEELRDATLAASSNLDRVPGESSPATQLQVIELRNNGPEALRLLDLALESRKRSVYLPLLRGITPRSLDVFDFADQGMVTGSRDATTVPPQALYMLNDPFVRRQALALAERLLAEANLDDRARVSTAFRQTLAREATTGEIERALTYVTELQAEAGELLAAAPSGGVAQSAPDETTGNGDAAITEKKPPANPDEIDQTDAPATEPDVVAASPAAAAWASLCQALFASAEFRFLP